MPFLRRSSTARIALLSALGALTVLIAGWVVLASQGHSGLAVAGTAVVRTGSPTATAQGSATAAQTQRPAPGTAAVVNPRSSPQAFQAGVTVLVYGNDPAFDSKTRAVLDRLAGLRVNSVSLAFPVFQSNWTASDVHTDAGQTPSLDNIATFSREAHRRGFTVMLRPLLDEQSLQPDGKWRGTISPTNPAAWFASYGAVMSSYARFAQANGVEVVDVATELVSLQGDTGRWTNLITTLRRLYRGQLTYSANWSQPSPGFGRALDFLGVDAFFPLGAPVNASTDQLVRAWSAWLPQLDQLGRTIGRPVLITELGTTSEKGSYQQPWVWSHGTGVSLEAQSRYYAAACQALKSRVTGMYWWDFGLDPLASPGSDIGFVPEGKPAELQIAACFR